MATGIRVVIPFTTPELTRAALKAAARFCRQAIVVAVDVVPFPCPLDQSLVDESHLERQLLHVVQGTTVPVRVRVVRARDFDSAYQSVLKPDTVILIATKRHWWRTCEEKLARRLLRAGHDVVVISARGAI